MKEHLERGILRFWLENGVDREHGGYLTCFDAEGKAANDTDKYLVTQTRMIWGMSALFSMFSQRWELQDAARQGVEFLLAHFWDEKYGGWSWKVRRDGSLVDGAKLVYGQSFAIYALSQYTMSTGDTRGLDYAQRTFDLLQTYCTDTRRGWPVSRLLQPGPSAYSDLAVLPDGTVLCFYENGRRESSRKIGRPWAYACLTVARFNLDWLTGGKGSPK